MTKAFIDIFYITIGLNVFLSEADVLSKIELELLYIESTDSDLLCIISDK